MENDYFINRMNISHYQALLRTNLDDRKRATVEVLLSELEAHHKVQSYPAPLRPLTIIF